jgi:dipeptidase E
MKLLLTSAGIKNASIHNSLVDLLGKPVAESTALCIPTASYGHPEGGLGAAWGFITGRGRTPVCELGWKSLGVLELTALPSIDEELWVPKVEETDALLVGGGDALYLCHWMRQSGLGGCRSTAFGAAKYSNCGDAGLRERDVARSEGLEPPTF